MRGGQVAVYLLLIAGFCLSVFPDFFSTLSLPSHEEQMNGNLAKDLLDGAVTPLVEYRYQKWTTGQFVYGFALYPAFAVFGQYDTVIKVYGAAFSLATMLLWFAFLRRYAGRLPAFAGVLFFLAPPLLYAKYTVIAYGNHKESALFAIVLLFLLYRLLETRKSARRAFVIGLAAGFGSFFCLQVLAPTATVLLLWLGWRERSEFKYELPFFAAGFAVGFLPCVVWFLAQGENVLEILFPLEYGRSVSAALVDKFVFKIPRLWLATIPASLQFESYHAAYIYLLFVGVALGVVVHRERHLLSVFANGILRGAPNITEKSITPPVWLPVLLFLALFSVAYALSRFSVEEVGDVYWSRYLIPVYPFFFAALAVAISRYRPFSSLLIVFVVLSLCWHARNFEQPLRNFVAVVKKGDLTRVATAVKGYYYIEYLDQGLARALKKMTPAEFASHGEAMLRRVSPEYRWKAFEVWGRVSGLLRLDSAVSPTQVDAAHLNQFLAGWAAGAVESAQSGANEDLVFSPAILEDVVGRFGPESDLTSAAWMGVGRRIHDSLLVDSYLDNTLQALKGEARPWHPEYFHAAQHIIAQIPPDQVAAAAEGIGMAVAHYSSSFPRLRRALALLFAAADPTTVWQAFLTGVGRGMAREITAIFNHVPQNALERPAAISDGDWLEIKKGLFDEFWALNYQLSCDERFCELRWGVR